ncbi:MAG TPA: hypothetical protein VML00_05690 [Bacteroidota bacterium]|nr:hypothetical protein [Bacteroidota bacterium]
MKLDVITGETNVALNTDFTVPWSANDPPCTEEVGTTVVSNPGIFVVVHPVGEKPVHNSNPGLGMGFCASPDAGRARASTTARAIAVDFMEPPVVILDEGYEFARLGELHK